MKRIIYYVLLITSIFCLQVKYAVAVSNTELTSESSGWLVVTRFEMINFEEQWVFCVPQTTVKDRNVYQQMRCKRIKDGKITSPVDQGGHLIASQFGGPGEQINYVPMAGSLNGGGGEWYEMEMAWAKFLDPTNTNTITNVVITIQYCSTKKPTKFIIRWEENGALKSQEITNQ